MAIKNWKRNTNTIHERRWDNTESKSVVVIQRVTSAGNWMWRTSVSKCEGHSDELAREKNFQTARAAAFKYMRGNPNG